MKGYIISALEHTGNFPERGVLKHDLVACPRGSIGLRVKATGTLLFIKDERLTRYKQGSRMIKVVVESDAAPHQGLS